MRTRKCLFATLGLALALAPAGLRAQSAVSWDAVLGLADRLEAEANYYQGVTTEPSFSLAVAHIAELLGAINTVSGLRTADALHQAMAEIERIEAGREHSLPSLGVLIYLVRTAAEQVRWIASKFPVILRGDSNGDTRVGVLDVIHQLRVIFLGGVTTPCAKASDSNDDGRLDIRDPLATLQHLFVSAPSNTFGVCARDVNEDRLSCAVSSCPSSSS